ncbi:MAG TPA: hypothetical protein VKR31_00370 [Rhizomicrobium sp.]|nr:hypothetical protein [Rhizomicrobium sp.]
MPLLPFESGERKSEARYTEKRVATLRKVLANLDAAIAILTPDHPNYVAPRRSCKRTAYFPAG